MQVEPWAIRAGVGSFLLLYGVYDIFWVGERERGLQPEEAKLASVATTIPYGFAAGFSVARSPSPVLLQGGVEHGEAGVSTIESHAHPLLSTSSSLSLARFNAEGLLSADIVAQGSEHCHWCSRRRRDHYKQEGRPRGVVMSSAGSSPVWGALPVGGVLGLREGTASRASSVLLS